MRHNNVLRIFNGSGDEPARPKAARTAYDIVTAYLREIERLASIGEVTADHAANVKRSLEYSGGDRYVSYADLFGHSLLGELTQSDLQAWFARNPQWKAGDTRAGHLSAVLACFHWADEASLCRPCPYRKTKREKRLTRKRMRRDATDAETKAILDRCSQQMLKLLVFVDRTGVRTCEAYGLRWADISWRESVIVLDKHKTERQLDEPEPRTIALDPEMAIALRAWFGNGRDANGHVFLNTKGQPWNRRSFAGAFRKLRRRIGLAEDLTPYCFRHRFGTQAILAGMSDRETGDLMGHKDPRTTRRYTHTIGKRSYLTERAAELAKRRAARK